MYFLLYELLLQYLLVHKPVEWLQRDIHWWLLVNTFFCVAELQKMTGRTQNLVSGESRDMQLVKACIILAKACKLFTTTSTTLPASIHLVDFSFFSMAPLSPESRIMTGLHSINKRPQHLMTMEKNSHKIRWTTFIRYAFDCGGSPFGIPYFFSSVCKVV
jgi:hypothetical protein